MMQRYSIVGVVEGECDVLLDELTCSFFCFLGVVCIAGKSNIKVKDACIREAKKLEEEERDVLGYLRGLVMDKFSIGSDQKCHIVLEFYNSSTPSVPSVIGIDDRSIYYHTVKILGFLMSLVPETTLYVTGLQDQDHVRTQFGLSCGPLAIMHSMLKSFGARSLDSVNSILSRIERNGRLDDFRRRATSAIQRDIEGLKAYKDRPRKDTTAANASSMDDYGEVMNAYSMRNSDGEEAREKTREAINSTYHVASGTLNFSARTIENLKKRIKKGTVTPRMSYFGLEDFTTDVSSIGHFEYVWIEFFVSKESAGGTMEMYALADTWIVPTVIDDIVDECMNIKIPIHTRVDKKSK